MKHKNTTLAIAAIVAAVALTTATFVIPQQVLAHSGHHHNNNNNSIKVDQQISQANVCNGTSTLCLNNGNNTADINR
jgi:hypothetical protein